MMMKMDLMIYQIMFLNYIPKICIGFRLLMQESLKEKVMTVTIMEQPLIYSWKHMTTKQHLQVKYGQMTQCIQISLIQKQLIIGNHLQTYFGLKKSHLMDYGLTWMKPLTSVMEHVMLIKLPLTQYSWNYHIYQLVET